MQQVWLDRNRGGIALEQFEQIAENGWTALLRKEWRSSLKAALLERRGCVPMDKGGRGCIERFEFEGGVGVIRQYRRGGLIRHFLKDSYLLCNRALRELSVLQTLYNKGLPVPEPLGAAWRQRGPWFQGLLAMRLVPGVNLVEYLSGPSKETDNVLREVGALIRRMHDLGAFHADLNARNIMVDVDAIHLIDFDNARMMTSVSETNRTRNLLRLRRSLEKNGFPGQPFAIIREGYGLKSLPRWLDMAYDLKGRLSDSLSGRRSNP